MMRIVLGLVLSVLILPSFSQAQEEEKRKIEINFEDELIRGDVKKPELFYLLQRKQFNFKRMIRLREDFLPEMRSTGERLKISGGEG
ncbi:MAG: hypothetical protein VX642_04700 [Bdellovibrionota bacterium]|nr:hypothetical protein [Bdellovibrionota bacterium]